MSTATAPVQTGRRPATPADRKCTRQYCGGRIEPSTDRNGSSVNECQKCGYLYRTEIAAAGVGEVVGPLAISPSARRNCAVKGCGGVVVGSNPCPQCAKRQAFLEKNLPKRFCQVCEGELPHRATKYCKACAPIASRVAVQKRKADGPSATSTKKKTK